MQAYPFGMIMPGRQYEQGSNDFRYEGTTTVNGHLIPRDMAFYNRGDFNINRFVASRSIELREGFASAENEELTMEIQPEGSNYDGGGNQGILTSNGGPYRYGFNGQEKSDEIKGDGNSYTAEFWEFDPRLGRRWNLDPVIKPFLSPYSAFRNNPLMYVDPKGDDDIFSNTGKYLGRTSSGSSVRILNANATLKDAQKNVMNSTKLITDLTYMPTDADKRIMLSSIMSHYAVEARINKTVIVADVSEKDGGGFAFFRTKDKSYNIVVYNGKLNPQAGDAYNIINAFIHEKYHEDDESSTMHPLNHTSAIFAEINDERFEKTTLIYKYAAGTYAATLLTEALALGTKVEDVKSKIEEFNNSKLGKYALLQYDEKSKSVVSSSIDQDEVIVTPPKNKKKPNE